MSTTTATDLTPSTEILLQECPRARVLVLGKSGAGKSALINAVFGANLTEVVDSKAGVHNIESELTSSSNDCLVVHDSEGFEVGNEDNVKKVLEFIHARSENNVGFANRLHAIWVCAEIPHANGRLFEAGVEDVLKNCPPNLPVIVVFTKLDILDTRVKMDLMKQSGITRETFETTVQTEVKSLVEELCAVPLCELTHGRGYRWLAVSTKRKFEHTIKALISLALEMTQLETVWLSLAIAQRSKAEVSLKASVKYGWTKKVVDRSISGILIGLSMERVINVLRLDIVRIWNMKDPEEYLLSPNFLALVTVVVEDMYERTSTDYPMTKAATQGLLQNPTMIVCTGPMLILTFVVEWVKGSYKKTKSSLRCLAAFIIDLSLTMDVLFYLTRGGQPLTIRLINTALKFYQRRKGPVHNSIRSWIDRLQSNFSHLDPKRAVDEMEHIICEYCIIPREGSKMQCEVQMNESWITREELKNLTG